MGKCAFNKACTTTGGSNLSRNVITDGRSITNKNNRTIVPIAIHAPAPPSPEEIGPFFRLIEQGCPPTVGQIAQDPPTFPQVPFLSGNSKGLQFPRQRPLRGTPCEANEIVLYLTWHPS